MDSGKREPRVDPTLLEILGAIAQAIGLAEQVERALPLRRMAIERKHKTIEKQILLFKEQLDDARAALRVVRSSLESALSEVPASAVGISLPRSEFSIFRRGLQHLHVAIGKMTAAAQQIELLASSSSSEQERFYRVSQAGGPVLQCVARALELMARGGDEETGDVAARHDDGSGLIEETLESADRYLARCSRHLDERDEWLG